MMHVLEIYVPMSAVILNENWRTTKRFHDTSSRQKNVLKYSQQGMPLHNRCNRAVFCLLVYNYITCNLSI